MILVETQRPGHGRGAGGHAVLAAGHVLGVFPEGRIETSNDLIPFQSGIGLLALKTCAPVYPAYLNGTQRNREMVEAFLRPSTGSIAFGPALDLSDLEDSKTGIREATHRIQNAVEELKNRIVIADSREG